MSNWISVKERLPEEKKKVLVSVSGYGIHMDRWLSDDVGLFWNSFGESVTHWMPLPEPPNT